MVILGFDVGAALTPDVSIMATVVPWRVHVPVIFVLNRDGDELHLQVGGLRRTIVLPRALVDAPTTGAKMEDGVLRIRFGTRPEPARADGTKRVATTRAGAAAGGDRR